MTSTYYASIQLEDAYMSKELDEISGKAKGGVARAKSLTPYERREIAKKAASARWNDVLPRATHEGALIIGDLEIACAVLNDGRRMLTQSSFMRALGRARQAKGRAYYKGDVNLPAFLTAQNLKPFISSELEKTSSQIEFRARGRRAYGYPAELLPKICDVFLDAAKAGVLLTNQKHIAERAMVLMRGLAHVGIVALIDEATGYQEVRERQALQAILEAFLRKELAAWAKRFPDEFYQQIFRLKGWQWKGRRVNPPQVLGHYTKDIVYARLAPQILDELENRNPVERGKRAAKHHQWLTEDVGHPALAQHLHAVITLMRVSQTWEYFKEMLDIAHPKRGDTLSLPLMLDPPLELETATNHIISSNELQQPSLQSPSDALPTT